MDRSRAAITAWCRALPRRYPWLLPGSLLLILAALTVNVLTSGPLTGMDRWIRQIVQVQAKSATWAWVTPPARDLIALGRFQVAAAVLAMFAILAAARHCTGRPLLTAAVGIGLLLAATVPAKVLIGRPNPGQGVVHGLGAFPSGHTTTACVCYGLIAVLLAPEVPARTRRVMFAVAAAVGFLVGAALVWCDLHWFTDVAAGWVLAALIIQLTTRLTWRKTSSGGHRPGPPAVGGDDLVSDQAGLLAGEPSAMPATTS